MKVSYDREVDGAYLQFSSKIPNGATELAEGVILHTTAEDEIVGVEILGASARFPVETLFRYELLREKPSRVRTQRPPPRHRAEG